MSQPTVAEICRAIAHAPSCELPALIARYASDPRAGVIAALVSATRRLERDEAERQRLDRMSEVQLSLHRDGVFVVAGVDEVGRGCLAGPVTAGAVILPASARIAGIDDSKRLKPDARVRLDAEIRRVAEAVAVAHVEPSVIDAIGIAAANVLAMRRAIEALDVEVEHVLIDGLPVDVGRPATAVVGGDRLVAAIAAASIVAKVARDALMREMDARFPEYGFALNKGYGTLEHIDVITRIGPCELHRMSFSPCSQVSLF
ncbi:MAG: ribonuclease HII [Actinobacteria bacterium]|nr:MAG: ribonuclease HII [Actinomycetota bacterium]